MNYDEQFIRRESAAALLLGLRVRIPWVLGCLPLVNVIGQLEVFASRSSLVLPNVGCLCVMVKPRK